MLFSILDNTNSFVTPSKMQHQVDDVIMQSKMILKLEDIMKIGLCSLDARDNNIT